MVDAGRERLLILLFHLRLQLLEFIALLDAVKQVKALFCNRYHYYYTAFVSRHVSHKFGNAKAHITE